MLKFLQRFKRLKYRDGQQERAAIDHFRQAIRTFRADFTEDNWPTTSDHMHELITRALIEEGCPPTALVWYAPTGNYTKRSLTEKQLEYSVHPNKLAEGETSIVKYHGECVATIRRINSRARGPRWIVGIGGQPVAECGQASNAVQTVLAYV